METPKFNRRLWLCMVAACVVYLIFIWRTSFVVAGERFFCLFDDAMISMRYAKNLADGFGLRWNPGGPPVEGYTNFLWTVFMAGIHLLPIAVSKTSLVVMLAGVVILLLNLLVVREIVKNFAGENHVAMLSAVVMTAFYYPLIYWTLRGMEVGLLCLLIDVAILCALRLHDRYSAKDMAGVALALSAAVLTRPDMVVPVIVIGLFMIYVVWKSGFKTSYLIIPLLIIVAMGGLDLFRIKYYGDPLPNTYYLKVTGAPVMERVSRGLIKLLELAAYHLWPILLLLAAGFIKGFRRLTDPKMLLLLGLALGQTAYSVYVGGDAWEWMNFSNRYITIAIPVVFVVLSLVVSSSDPAEMRFVLAFLPFMGLGLCIQSIYYLTVKPDKVAAAGLIVPGLAVAALGAGTLLLNRRQRLSPPLLTAILTGVACVALNYFGAANWLMGKNSAVLILEDAKATRVGLLLQQATTPDARIAYVRAGATPYFAGREAIDLLGKSDPVIAKGRPATAFYPGHSKWNYAYSIGELKPDLVMDLWQPTDADEKTVLDSGYARCNGPYGFNTFVRKDSTNKINLTLLTQWK